MSYRRGRKMNVGRSTFSFTPIYQNIKGEGSSSFPENPFEGYGIIPKKIPVFGKDPIDKSSIEGKFGWTRVKDIYLPYIKRGTESYCSIRMIEASVLKNNLSLLNDLYTCTNILSYTITINEAELLTSINDDHCDQRYGIGAFCLKDLIINVKDAETFYDFLEFCYRKLGNPNSDPDGPCGFIRINNDSVVAYTKQNGVKCIPLFYFDGMSEYLKMKSKFLGAWELAYLKFCCKVQGIKEEFLKNAESCPVVSLSDLKVYFPSGTKFQEFWMLKSSFEFYQEFQK